MVTRRWRLAGGSTLLAAGCLLGAGAAAAQQPIGGTAPAYPGNTLKLEHASPIVAGTVVRVKLSGHAEWNEPTDVSTIPYTVSMYVQNAGVDGACSASYGQQLTKSINLPLNAGLGISGWVVSDDITINPAIPGSGIDWSTPSVPFAVRPGVSRVLLCGYQRYIIDDVAWFQLPVRVVAPACRAVRRSVTRPGKLRLRCNVSGRLTLRLRRGGRTRTLPVRISPQDGRGAIATRRLARGSYRVTVLAGSSRLGRPFRIRIR
jgi:hypothetical protein